MLFLYSIITLVSLGLGGVLKGIGVRGGWLIGVLIGVSGAIGFTVWVSWRVKHGPYP
jgi:hypothetical protein